jgi:carbon-monoxide dehydrogenase medium subunit
MLDDIRISFPTSIAEASELAKDGGDGTYLYAGGAELTLLIRYGLSEIDHLVDIKRIPGLVGTTAEPDGVVRIGAATTHHRLERDELLGARLPLLAVAESKIGNIRIRNQGTLGGNICFADPHSDPTPPLLVYQGTVVLQSGTQAPRELPVEEFVKDAYSTAAEPGELVTEIRCRPLPAGTGQCYLRSERFTRPTANVAVACRAEGSTVRELRLAVGSVCTPACRLRELEAALDGVSVGDLGPAIADHRALLAARLDPHGDALGSRQYKLHLAQTLLCRALQSAARRGEEHG